MTASALSREVEEEPREDKTKSQAAEELTQSLRVSLSLKVPNGLWSLGFQEAHLVGKEVHVYWRLTKRDGMGTMAIATVSDAMVLKAENFPEGLEIKHFVSGKTWGWENDTEENVVFIDASGGEKGSKGQRLETVE